MKRKKKFFVFILFVFFASIPRPSPSIVMFYGLGFVRALKLSPYDLCRLIASTLMQLHERKSFGITHQVTKMSRCLS
jgi:hypothetical protein